MRVIFGSITLFVRAGRSLPYRGIAIERYILYKELAGL